LTIFPPWFKQKNTTLASCNVYPASTALRDLHSPVPGMAKFPLTTTGQPPLTAAVYRACVEKRQRQKLDAPKTATRPIGR